MSRSMAKIKANSGHKMFTHSGNVANTDDSKSLSDIFARCGRTINPLLENTRSAGEELAGTTRIQAFSSLKSQAQGQGLRSEGLGLDS